MAGSCSVSNLTVCDDERCSIDAATVLLMADAGAGKLLLTVNDGTNDLVDLANIGGVSASEASRQSRSEALGDGLERPLDSGWPSESRSS